MTPLQPVMRTIVSTMTKGLFFTMPIPIRSSFVTLTPLDISIFSPAIFTSIIPPPIRCKFFCYIMTRFLICFILIAMMIIYIIEISVVNSFTSTSHEPITWFTFVLSSHIMTSVRSKYIQVTRRTIFPTEIMFYFVQWFFIVPETLRTTTFMFIIRTNFSIIIIVSKSTIKYTILLSVSHMWITEVMIVIITFTT